METLHEGPFGLAGISLNLFLEGPQIFITS